MTQAPPAVPAAPPGGGPMQPHRGTMILVFGILGLVCCIIFGILAWIMGNNDLKEMDAGRKDPSGRGLTQAGKILGMVACILAIIGVIIQIIVLALGGGMMVFSSY